MSEIFEKTTPDAFTPALKRILSFPLSLGVMPSCYILRVDGGQIFDYYVVQEAETMPKIRPMGRFISALYGSAVPLNETEDWAAARWVAATEPCVECGGWLELGDGLHL
ncbi:MAG: hypothetical protein ACR2JC_01425 [Chloroflexota bacterium]